VSGRIAASRAALRRAAGARVAPRSAPPRRKRLEGIAFQRLTGPAPRLTGLRRRRRTLATNGGLSVAKGIVMPVDEPPEPGRERLDALEARIRAAREARRPKPSGRGDISAASVAWRMVTELVLGLLIGAGIGWGIDGALGTGPIFLIVFGLLGFAAGVRTMMRSAEEIRRRGERRAAQERDAAGGDAGDDDEGA